MHYHENRVFVYVQDIQHLLVDSLRQAPIFSVQPAVLCYVMDLNMARNGLLPTWYVKLRFTLSVGATAAMLFTFMFYVV